MILLSRFAFAFQRGRDRRKCCFCFVDFLHAAQLNRRVPQRRRVDTAFPAGLVLGQRLSQARDDSGVGGDRLVFHRPVKRLVTADGRVQLCRLRLRLADKVFDFYDLCHFNRRGAVYRQDKE